MRDCSSSTKLLLVISNFHFCIILYVCVCFVASKCANRASETFVFPPNSPVCLLFPLLIDPSTSSDPTCPPLYVDDDAHDCLLHLRGPPPPTRIAAARPPSAALPALPANGMDRRRAAMEMPWQWASLQCCCCCRSSCAESHACCSGICLGTAARVSVPVHGRLPRRSDRPLTRRSVSVALHVRSAMLLLSCRCVMSLPPGCTRTASLCSIAHPLSSARSCRPRPAC